MSSFPATTAPSPSQQQQQHLVVLPAHHKLYCWKVRNGSSVQAGETIALAQRIDAAGATTSTTPAAAAAKPQHKRPSKRRRPKPQAAPVTAAEVGTAAAVAPSLTENGNVKNSSKEASTSAPTQIPLEPEQPSQLATVALVAPRSGIVRMGAPKTAPPTSGIVIGYLEACQHPTIVQGLCAVCGQETDLKKSSTSLLENLQQHEPKTRQSNNSSKVTVSGLTMLVSQAEGQRMAEADAERLRLQKKLSLVLDLDHTLVHATNDVRARQHLNRDDVRSLVLPLLEGTGAPPAPGATPQQPLVWMHHYVKLRPYVKEFLQRALPLYEIGVYTAGTREYAEQVLLLLARNVVGCHHDTVTLEQLRLRVRHAQIQVQRAKEQEKVQKWSAGATAKTTAATDEVNGTSNDTKTQANDPPRPADDTVMNDTADKGNAPSSEASSPNSEESSKKSATESNETKQGVVEHAGMKRKKGVSWGELPPATRRKTEHVTPQQELERLQEELDQHERLERQAIDLRQRLFGGRVVSRTDVGDLGRDVKSLTRIFPCGGTMAAVVDDREDVWANAQDAKSAHKGEPPYNLLLVRPYHWGSFLGFADVNNPSGADLSGENGFLNGDETEKDEQLLWTTDILERVHKRYYASTAQPHPTVPDILREMRSEVLAGSKMVLSGLVPLHKQQRMEDISTSYPRPPVVRYAQDMGATLLPSVTNQVTHVVAAKDGTDKTIAARKVRGCFVVKASWLMECLWSLTRRDETPHLLGPQKSDETAARPLVVNMMRENTGSSSSDEDDDELAAEFENEMMGDAS